MTVKDFTVGQNAYIVERGRVRESNKRVLRIVPVETLSIGRVYVTVNRFGKIQFYDRGCGEEYLVDKTPYSSTMMLFPTEQSANDYIEKDRLCDELRDALNSMQLKYLTLEQLRAIHDIIKEGE